MTRRLRETIGRLRGDLQDPGRVNGLTWAKRVAALLILPPACWLAFQFALAAAGRAISPSRAERDASGAAFFAFAEDLMWAIEPPSDEHGGDMRVRSGHYSVGTNGRLIHLTGSLSDEAFGAGRAAASNEFARVVARHADDLHRAGPGAVHFPPDDSLVRPAQAWSSGSPPGFSGSFGSPVQTIGYLVRSATYDRDGMRGVLTLSISWERRLVVLTIVEQPR